MDCGGTVGWRWCLSCQNGEAVTYWCRKRDCVRCGKLRQYRLIEVYSKALEEYAGKRWRFLTLTLPRKYMSLKRGINILTPVWQKVRRRKEWQDHIDGGITSIEAVPSSEGWNLHLHILCWGKYWPQANISALVAKAGFGPVCFIRLVRCYDCYQTGSDCAHGDKAVLQYMVHYSYKCPEGMSESTSIEYNRALKHRKLAIPFGDIHGKLFYESDYQPEVYWRCGCGDELWKVMTPETESKPRSVELPFSKNGIPLGFDIEFEPDDTSYRF